MPKLVRYLFLLPVIFIFSCEKTIVFTPREQETKLVVDATIETGKKPLVYLSTSLNFFSNISIDRLKNAFVRNASIQISDGSKTATLREYSESVQGGLTVYYYSTGDSGQDSAFLGEQGKTYTMHISAEGKEYDAQTTIPILAKRIEALFYEDHVDKEDTTKVILYGIFNDPPGLGNYTRYFTQTNDEPFYPGLNSIFDDQVTDGKKYKIQIEKGVDRNQTIDFNEYSFFHKGDQITVKYCDIDKATYDFWRTMEYSYSSIGNPFSSPTKVQGNISNGALGYFGGYAVQYSRILIPE